MGQKRIHYAIRRLGPLRYTIMRGCMRGKRKPVRFLWLSSFQHRADAEMVAYWLRKDATYTHKRAEK